MDDTHDINYQKSLKRVKKFAQAYLQENDAKLLEHFALTGEVDKKVLGNIYNRGSEDSILLIAELIASNINRCLQEFEFDLVLGWVPKQKE